MLKEAWDIEASTMTILYLHGWQSTLGGVKPTYLKDHGHTVLHPITRAGCGPRTWSSYEGSDGFFVRRSQLRRDSP